MEVICTQSKTCKIYISDIHPDHRMVIWERGFALYTCIHKDIHHHTVLCELKCCDQRGMVKCRGIETK